MGYRYVAEEELELLKQVVDSQQCWRVGRPDGENFVDRFEDAFAARTGRRFAHAMCTGSAANQAALAGLGIGPVPVVFLFQTVRKVTKEPFHEWAGRLAIYTSFHGLSSNHS